ncbi:MAG: hypothetical protein JOZ38_04065 [Candidatus Eremiobacteraeota bacterium]|nr:hypothetical protein [Candidatus Eremiobacteraeota bacterium]
MGLLLCASTLSGGLAAAAPERDGAIILNSGSTNTAAYTIKVWSDGTTELTQRGTSAAGAALSDEATDGFFASVRDARNTHAPANHCMKSVSFGTTLVVRWHGWTSVDLNCPVGGANAALREQTLQIVGAMNLRGEPGRVRLLPNEPRRFEGAPTPATPKPTGP